MRIRIIQSFVQGRIASRVGDQLTVGNEVAAQLISDGFAVSLEATRTREKAIRTEATNRKKAVATE